MPTLALCVTVVHMPRINPRVELLERQLASLRATLERRKEDPGVLPAIGCGDGSCAIVAPEGMHTNGGCHCTERKLRLALWYYKQKSVFLEESIRRLKEYGLENPF